jgi:hypothetical protein
MECGPECGHLKWYSVLGMTQLPPWPRAQAVTSIEFGAAPPPPPRGGLHCLLVTRSAAALHTFSELPRNQSWLPLC